MWNHKVVCWLFASNQAGTLAAYLEEQARKGWYLDSGFAIDGLFLVFQKGVPRDMQFSVVLFPENESMEEETENLSQGYREMCEEYGWNYEGRRQDFLIFSHEDPHALPVETDSSMQMSVIRQSLLYRDLPLFLLLDLFLLFGVVLNFRQFYLIAASDSRLLANGLNLLAVLGILGYVICQVSWYLRANKKAADGRDIIIPSMKMVRAQTLCFYGAFLIFLLFAQNGSQHLIPLWKTILSSLLAIMVVVTVYCLVLMRYRRNRSRGKKKDSRWFAVIYACILIVLIRGLSLKIVTLPEAAANQGQVEASELIFPIQPEHFGYSFCPMDASDHEDGTFADYTRAGYQKQPADGSSPFEVTLQYYQTGGKTVYHLLAAQMKDDKGNAYTCCNGPEVNTLGDVVVESYEYKISHQGFEGVPDYYLFVIKNGTSILKLGFEGAADTELVEDAVNSMQTAE